jgi:hypothetical protein
VFNGAENPVRMTDLMSVAVANVEPLHAETLRAGARFYGGAQNGATGMAQATAIPTTTAAAVLANGETGGNAKSYVVDLISWFPLGGTIGTGGILFASVFKLATPAAQASWSSVSSSGSSKSTKAVWALAQTAPTGTSWFVWGSSSYSPTVNLTAAQGLPQTGGTLLVPPGYALGLSVVSAAGTSPTYGVSASWVELELDIE